MQTIIGGSGAAATNGAGAALVKDTDTKNFAKDVIEESRRQPVIVDFWAPWCGPCKTLGPLLERLVKAAKGAVKMVKLNVDQNQALAAQFRIQSIPAVFAFADGRPVDGFVGALPESQLKQFIDALARGGKGGAPGEDPLAQVLDMAKEAFNKGDAGTAASLYARILDQDPDNAPARLGLARAAIALGEVEQAKQMLDELPPEAKRGADYDAAKAALDLAERAASAGAKAGDLGAFEDRIAANPNDHQARYDFALALYAAGHAESAITHLLEIVRRNRTWNEEAARKELLKLFEALGPTNELTVKGRRGLSAILFS
ncbi:MAG: thioredoxin [Rhodospirillaceae bacterium]|nr:thioredoxin [Rhodospirillaceae bacterium]